LEQYIPEQNSRGGAGGADRKGNMEEEGKVKRESEMFSTEE
jgi:hypothetical protein